MPAVAKALDPTRRGFATEELAAHLRMRVIGQSTPVDEVIGAFQTQMVGLSPANRPLASFLFLGPTGTGKTHIVEALSEAIYGTPHAVLKVDCAEFGHGHEIAKLIGSPPGYLGHRETHPALSQKALDRHHTETTQISLVLFDEIEKASDSLWNLLLGILDKATLTLGDNSTVDFSRAMIFLTSNLGAKEIQASMVPGLGFAPQAALSIETQGVAAARRKFTPEFMNRIDRTVVFNPLGHDDLVKILGLELDHLQRRIGQAAMRTLRTPHFLLEITEAARDFLLTEGTDIRYGARHLKRAIERYLTQPIANLLASGQIADGDILTISKETGKDLVFSV